MSVEEYDALTKAFRDRTSTKMFGPKDIFPHEVALETKGAELQRGDPTLSSQDAVELAIHLQKSKPFDENKLIKVHIEHHREVAVKMKLKEEEEDEPDSEILLN